MDIFVIWEYILQRIHTEDPQFYDKFKKSVFPVSLSNQTLFLTSSDEYLSNGWFQTVYQEKISSFLSEKLNAPAMVLIKNNFEKENKSSFPLTENTISLNDTIPDFFPFNINQEENLPDFMNTKDNSSLPEIKDIIQNKELSSLQKKQEENKIIQMGINPEYTFDSFIYSNQSGNEVAYHAAMAVAEDCLNENMDNQWNPLFIYGHSGLGKTHLLHAICNYVYQHAPQKSFLFISSEQFIHEFVSSLRLKKMDDFREKYRALDYFLLDDVQYLGPKDQTKIELFNTFNTLFNNKKHLIMTSDCPPRDIQKMEKRLTSRMAQGLNVPIDPPGFEVCFEIIQKEAEKDHIIFPNEVLTYLADHIKSNIRDLKGAYKAISFYHTIRKEQITLSMAKEIIKNMISASHHITVDSIIDTVCEYFEVKKEDLLSKGRPKRIVIPRQIAMYLCRTELNLSYPTLQKEFHRKDHSTIIYACERVIKDLKTDKNTQAIITTLQKRIKGE